MKEFDTTQLILFILFLCILIISIVFLIHSIKKLSEKIKAKKIAYVKAHSLLYKKLLELNSKSPTTSSTGGLILALQRAILLLAPQGGVTSTFTGPL